MDKVRCSSCRGAKQVAKLGGMLGECNLCNGTGSILASEKIKIAEIETVAPASELIKKVASVAAIKIEKPMKDVIADCVVPVTEAVKVDPKKAIYKRKTASK